jgi:hypothetical protein
MVGGHVSCFWRAVATNRDRLDVLALRRPARRRIDRRRRRAMPLAPCLLQPADRRGSRSARHICSPTGGCHSPISVAFALPEGPYPGVFGVKVRQGGYVVVAGKNERWVRDQTALFLRKLAPYGLVHPLPFVRRLGRVKPARGRSTTMESTPLS